MSTRTTDDRAQMVTRALAFCAWTAVLVMIAATRALAQAPQMVTEVVVEQEGARVASDTRKGLITLSRIELAFRKRLLPEPVEAR